MRVVSMVLVALFAAVALVAPVNADPIQRAQLEQMFAQMRANAPWNVDGPLLWGYFFTKSLTKTELCWRPPSKRALRPDMRKVQVVEHLSSAR